MRRNLRARLEPPSAPGRRARASRRRSSRRGAARASPSTSANRHGQVRLWFGAHWASVAQLGAPGARGTLGRGRRTCAPCRIGCRIGAATASKRRRAVVVAAGLAHGTVWPCRMDCGSTARRRRRARCWWCGDDPLYVDYHDHEWGRLLHDDDSQWFEKLCLEGFQAGLAWITILRKRDNFRAAFAGFDIDAVAGFDEADVQRLLCDAGIVRHRGKIESTINNAHRADRAASTSSGRSARSWSSTAALARPVSARTTRSANQRRVDGDVQGPAQARLVLRRADHDVHDDAVRRSGQRPRPSAAVRSNRERCRRPGPAAASSRRSSVRVQRGCSGRPTSPSGAPPRPRRCWLLRRNSRPAAPAQLRGPSPPRRRGGRSRACPR